MSAFVRWWTGRIGASPLLTKGVGAIVLDAREHVRRDPQSFKKKQYYAGLISRSMDFLLWPQVARVYRLAKWLFSLFSPIEVEGPAVFERLADIFSNPVVVASIFSSLLWLVFKTTRLIRRIMPHLVVRS
jgi:hypothetical protein